MSTAITAAPVGELLDRLNRRDLSAVEVARAFLAQIHKLDGEIGAFLSVDSAAALTQAEQLDQRRERGESLGPLAGLPVAVKDVICRKSVV